jgi:hypothetical protein
MTGGITGHQDLGPPETVSWVARTIDELIDEYGIDRGVTCLARGADQLYAILLQRRGRPYVAVIPSHDYSTVFAGPEDSTAFSSFLARAAERDTLPFTQASEEAYYAAGKRVVDLSDVLLAAWNGLPAKGLGGTADIVAYARTQGKPVIHIDTTQRSVKRL